MIKNIFSTDYGDPSDRLLTEGYHSIFYNALPVTGPQQQEMKMNRVYTYECSYCEKRGDKVTSNLDHGNGNQYPDGWAIVRTFKDDRYHDDTACKACVPKHKKKKKK